MVTPITTPPVLVDVTAYQFFTTGNFFVGPVQDSGNLYAALLIIDGIGVRIETLQSTDNGATWVRLDDGGGTSILINGIAPIFQATGIFWFFGAVNPADTFSANFEDEQSFDFATGLFLALVSDSGGAGYSGAMRAQLRSDNSVVLTFGDASGAEGRIFSGGSLGTKFAVDATSGNAPYGLLTDSSDVAHVLISAGPPFTSFDYRTITGAGTVSGSVSVSLTLEPSDQPVADSGNIAFPYINDLGAHARATLVYATGATSNPATASWVEYDVWTGTLDATSEDSSPFAVMDGSDLLVFWINVSSAGIARVYSARFNGGGFDAPILFYDSALYPPAGSTQDPTMRGLSVVSLSGSFVGIVAMDIDGSGNQTFYLSSGGAVQSGYRNRVY